VTRVAGLLLAGLALAGLAGCDKDKEVDLPAELVDIESRIAVKRLWSTSVSGNDPALRLALGLAGDGERLFAAGHDGSVHAFALEDGREIWRFKSKLGLSAGPGVGEGLVVVGTNDGDLLALAAVDGTQRWRVKLSGEVLAAPLVAGGKVVVRTVDGRLRALGAVDGAEAWVIEEPVPRLSLRGNAPPVLSGDAVLSGFDTGKLVAVTLASGELLWEALVSAPRGRTELERLSDLDAAVHVAGDDIYAVGFQGRVAMLARESGQVWWGRDASSYRGLALDDDRLYVSSSTGDVLGMQRRDGSLLWTQEGLKHRRLGAPAVVGSTVLVGDFEGYLHFLDRDSGEFVARERLGSDRISAAPFVVGDRAFVIDDGGKLVAFRIGS
jgi:outer membrane protein assembly factor BamB